LAQDGVRYLTKPVQSTALEGLLRSRSRAAVLAARSAS
jgi:hypothetical protein